MSPTTKDNVTCSADSSPTSDADLKDILDQQGITLDTKGKNLIDLVAKGKTVLEALCYCKDDRKDGPFLLVVKASLPTQDDYRTLLSNLTSDETLAALFDPLEPAYVSVLRCRPAFWKVLKECYAAEQSASKPDV